MTQLPPVPLTLEGASVLHQMFRVRWGAWNALASEMRAEIAAEAAAALQGMAQTAVYSLLGHKGDLMLLHFRRDFALLSLAQSALNRLRLAPYLKPASSYLSMVELSLYESSVKLYADLTGRGVQPDSPEWERAVEETVARQRQAMASRLWPEIPASPYICFYPMDRRRGEQVNWYQLPIADRARMMRDHGLIGRRWGDQVKQIITGSVGLDDFEWGVDLFAADPVAFKKLIYEMRFDEASAAYALFGPFYIGVRREPAEMGALLNG
ncbi:MAG: hydrogen peroxide-dependent heme synthase [Bryobacteraceae bacterium]